MWLGNHASHTIYVASHRILWWEIEKMKEDITYNLSWKWRLPRTNSKHLDIFLLHENEKSQTTSAPLNHQLYAAHKHTRTHRHNRVELLNEKKRIKETEWKKKRTKREWWISKYCCCSCCAEKRIAHTIHPIRHHHHIYFAFRFPFNTHSFHSHF